MASHNLTESKNLTDIFFAVGIICLEELLTEKNLLLCCFTSTVNSYDHVGAVS